MNMDTDTVILLLVILLLHVVPRPYVRRFRRCLSRFVYWQWRKMSRMSAVLYWWLHERVNGNSGNHRGNGDG